MILYLQNTPSRFLASRCHSRVNTTATVRPHFLRSCEQNNQLKHAARCSPASKVRAAWMRRLSAAGIRRQLCALLKPHCRVLAKVQYLRPRSIFLPLDLRYLSRKRRVIIKTLPRREQFHMFQRRYQRHILSLIHFKVVRLLRTTMNLERLEWTPRPYHKPPKLVLPPRPRNDV